MSVTIKELRAYTDLSQKEFAEKFNIPVSTLRKWEQGESKPAPYIIGLLANMIPVDDGRLELIRGRDGERYYYNKNTKSFIDSSGTSIKVFTDINGVKRENLPLYVKELFESYYDIVDKFDRDCRFDRFDNIIWS